MMRTILQHWPQLFLTLVVLCLVMLGITWLDVPPIYRLTHHAPFMLYRGYVALGLAGLLICAHRWAVSQLLWLSVQIHRWVSALAMLAIVGVDASMHLLSIPHMEGWWVPLLGGGLISSIRLRLAKYAQNHKP